MINTDIKLTFDAIPEPDLPFEDEKHRLFLLSNELNQERTYRILSNSDNSVKGNTIVGPSGFFILNITAKRGLHPSSSETQIENIVIFDRSTRVEHFWENITPLICKSEYADFAPALTHLLSQNKVLYFKTNQYDIEQSYKKYISRLIGECTTQKSWFSTPEKYNFIKNIFVTGHFFFKRVDLFDDNALKCAQLLKEHHLNIDTLYLSNIAEYAQKREDIEKLRSYVQTLVTIDTFIVLTKFRRNDEIQASKVPPEQIVVSITDTPSATAKILQIPPHLCRS